jgi:hypothetical protein
MSIAPSVGANLNWKNTRIGVNITFVDSSGTVQTPVTLSLLASVETSERTKYKKIHGLEGFNQGVSEQESDYTFSISVPVNVDLNRSLQMLQIARMPFTMEVLNIETATSKDNYRLLGEKLLNCYIETASKRITIGELPYVQYNGFALQRDVQIITSQSSVAETRAYLSTLAGMNDKPLGSGDPLELQTAYAHLLTDLWS